MLAELLFFFFLIMTHDNQTYSCGAHFTKTHKKRLKLVTEDSSGKWNGNPKCYLEVKEKIRLKKRGGDYSNVVLWMPIASTL